MIYTIKEQIEILEGRKLDYQRTAEEAWTEEQRAKARIELRRIEEKIKSLKGDLE